MFNYPPEKLFSIKRDLKKVIAGVVAYSQQYQYVINYE